MAKVCKKIHYNSEKKAQQVANSKKKGIRVYYCSNCKAWHLTKLTLATYERRTLLNKAMKQLRDLSI